MLHDNDRILNDPIDIENGSEYEMEDEHIKFVSSYYDIKNIVLSMGTDKFKLLFDSGIDNIRNSELAIQKTFVEKALEKIEELYGLKFHKEITIADNDDIERFYNFLYFIEYEIIKAIVQTIKHKFDFNPIQFLREKDKGAFFEEKINIDKLIKWLVFYLKKENHLILSFILFNDKTLLTNYFINKIVTYSDEFISEFFQEQE